MTDSRVPDRVERYVRRCMPDPPASATEVVIEQRGEMRLAPERDWMPFSAEQSMSAERTSFVWHARLKMAPLVTGVVEDAYEDGRGRLDARIWGVVPVAHARGLEVDRGEAQRYLAELVWCPLAMVSNPDLRWGREDEGSVRVWVHEEQTWVDLLFDAVGDIVGARTDTRSHGDVVEPWEGRFSEPRDYGGVRAPSKGEVWWETAEGRFVYWRGEILSMRWA